jgi:hypothetical protein
MVGPPVAAVLDFLAKSRARAKVTQHHSFTPPYSTVRLPSRKHPVPGQPPLNRDVNVYGLVARA